MGALLDATGHVVSLSSRLLVGRQGTAGLRVGDPSISGEHAVLAWRGGVWALRDLGSANGTTVNAERLSPGAWRALGEGDELRFGLYGGAFRLVDGSAPKPFARRRTDGLEVSATSEVLALPSASCPMLQIMPMGAGWVCSGDAGDHPIDDGETVAVCGQEWRVFLPSGAEETRRPSDLVRVQQLQLTFQVSADEETVLIELRTQCWLKRLESRAHNYLLLHLARHRLRDSVLPRNEQGWVDRSSLAQRLQLDAEHINVQLFRIRRNFAEAGVADAGNLIECRRRPSQVRIGSCALRVEPLDDSARVKPSGPSTPEPLPAES
jgi:FHA domain